VRFVTPPLTAVDQLKLDILNNVHIKYVRISNAYLIKTIFFLTLYKNLLYSLLECDKKTQYNNCITGDYSFSKISPIVVAISYYTLHFRWCHQPHLPLAQL